jgi:hypothetical protein
MAFPVTQAMRAGRRARAEERQKLYDALTLQQKLDGVPGHHAPAGKKARAKLLLQAQKQEEKAKLEAAAAAAKAASKAEKNDKVQKKNK